MKTVKAIAAFLDAKRDLSPRTLEQYGQALDYLELEHHKLPSKPRPIRDTLHTVTTSGSGTSTGGSGSPSSTGAVGNTAFQIRSTEWTGQNSPKLR